METTIKGLGCRDRIWGIWGSYYSIPKAMFYLLKGNSTPEVLKLHVRVARDHEGGLHKLDQGRCTKLPIIKVI